MSVFFTDTDCEMWYTDVDKYDIKVIEMPYTLDGEEHFYDMGRNTDFKKLFQRMREGSVPVTSALNPQAYIEYFEPYFKNGEDILYVHFSDKMSGTFEYMKNALNVLKEKYPERKLIPFNTKSICVGGGFQALEAAKMHKAGKSDQEIIDFLTEFSKHVAISFVVDSLSHLKRGGRISATTAVIGGLLNIKPILKVNDEGTIEKIGTGKGMRKSIQKIIETLKTNIRKIGEYPIYLLDADNKEDADWAEAEIRKVVGDQVEIVRYPVGPVIGTHCGPGTIGLVYYGESRK
ncbi:MAG: DegV family protein [Christensenellales bacterium]